MDEVEKLARAIYEARHGIGKWLGTTEAGRECYRKDARAALAHLKKPKPPEPKDEWREAIAALVNQSRIADIPTAVMPFVDKLLAAIAPLRERDETDARNTIESLKRILESTRELLSKERDIKSRGEWQQRAEAAEARLKEIENSASLLTPGEMGALRVVIDRLPAIIKKLLPASSSSYGTTEP